MGTKLTYLCTIHKVSPAGWKLPKPHWQVGLGLVCRPCELPLPARSRGKVGVCACEAQLGSPPCMWAACRPAIMLKCMLPSALILRLL